MKEKLKFSSEDACNIIYEYNKSYQVVEDKIVGTTRWSIVHEVVIKRVSDGKFFKSGYRVGATEIQDESPWEYETAIFDEVTPKEVTTIIYE